MWEVMMSVKISRHFWKLIKNISPPHHAIDLVLVGGKNKGLEEHLHSFHHERVTEKITLKPKGKILFTESLDDDELSILYHQALTLVHPSLYEGFNLPLVEGMSYGLPLIISDIPVHHEVTGDNALFFDPTSVDSIGTVLTDFLSKKSIAKELSQKSKERSADFSWQKCAKKTLEVYNLYT